MLQLVLVLLVVALAVPLRLALLVLKRRTSTSSITAGETASHGGIIDTGSLRVIVRCNAVDLKL